MILPDLPIELIFNLLCVCRRIASPSSQALRRAMYRRGLYFGAFDRWPRFAFWVRLCQNAVLLSEGAPPRPTLFVPDWLAMPITEQILHLLQAWIHAPKTPGLRSIRQRLPQRLLTGEPLTPAYQKEITGLQALGLCADDGLTAFGQALFASTSATTAPMPPKAWQLFEDELHVPYPPDWVLLWGLETYLDPIDPGIYSISEKTLRLAVQRGALDDDPGLIRILETGLDEPTPPGLIQKMEDRPVLKLLPGCVLEFSSPAELTALRASPAMRRDLAHRLSPRHVHLDPRLADRVLRRLQRRGLLASPLPLSVNGEGGRGEGVRCTKADRAYLLSIALAADGLELPISPPAGLLEKLTTGLEISLRASAARRAYAAIKRVYPDPHWVPEEEPPPMPEPELIGRIERAIKQEQSIDVRYQAHGRAMPEHRRLSPLAVEQRGLRFYLIAYCHKRRANRTFRLDRMQWLNAPPH